MVENFCIGQDIASILKLNALAVQIPRGEKSSVMCDVIDVLRIVESR